MREIIITTASTPNASPVTTGRQRRHATGPASNQRNAYE
jgi:hypothetical protein